MKEPVEEPAPLSDASSQLKRRLVTIVVVTALGTSGASARPPASGASPAPDAPRTTPSQPGDASASAPPAGEAAPSPPVERAGETPEAPPGDVAALVPGGEGGHLGAWLFNGPHPLTGVDDSKAVPALGRALQGDAGAGPRWTMGANGTGPINVARTVGARGNDVVAYAGGVLHVAKPGRYHLLLGVDDGVRVDVDGKTLFTRDERRLARDDDDCVPVDLDAGDHTVVLRLRHRTGGWAMTARVVDASFAPPDGAYFVLPGTTLKDARSLAASMASASFDGGASGEGYFPKVTVRFARGVPLGVPLPVRSRLSRASGGAPIFDVSGGVVAPRVGELELALPPLRAGDVKVEDQELLFETTVGERSFKTPFSGAKATREAIAHADRALDALRGKDTSSWLRQGSLDSVTHLRDRLVRFVSRGDTDRAAQRDEARELEAAAAALEKGLDPYATRTGPQRRAYRSPLDGRLAEYGLFVPASYRPDARRTWPLVMALHGLNGKPVAMLRYVIGDDDPAKAHDFEDRHFTTLPTPDAFIVAPNGHGNTMYRLLGNDDPLRVLDEVMAAYPIDRARVTVTGPSMGGIGAASLALRHPDRFAAAAPLCGYHSYFVRRDMAGQRLRPWERAIAEERSNAHWAWNGWELPLYVVHGTMDLPVANSGVLIDRYEALKYPIVHEHPKLGHNVWQTTYENLKGIKWLLGKTRDLHPKKIRFRTARLREDRMAWIRVGELATSGGWGEIEAEIKGRTAITASTKGITELWVDRDDTRIDVTAPVTLTLDGAALTFPPSDPIVAHKDGDAWRSGPAARPAIWKRGAVTGPMRDAFHEPLLFVYGASDPAQTRVNETVARAWARVGYGVDIQYPVTSDTEFMAKGEPLAHDRALFLVGNARSNQVLRALEPELPIRVEGDRVVAGGRSFGGPELGAAFIHPNPKRPDRYVVVVEGASAVGTLRSLSLPDLLPDFAIYDARVASARGHVVLGATELLAGGTFENDWSLPKAIDDPLAARR